MRNLIKLRVQEAKKSDIGRNIIRIDKQSMNQLKIQTGDVVEVSGEKQSAAIAWPSYPQDNGLGIVRIDSRLQKNTGTRIDDTLEIRKVKTEVAQNIVLAPSSVKIRNNPRFESFVKRKLTNYPITVDDFVFISLGISRELIFKVMSMIPSGVCIITQETILNISEEIVEDLYYGTEISFDDIGGLEKEIDEVKKIMKLASIKKFNIDIPKGILFEGFSGTGKTLLARIIANDLSYHFISLIAPEIIQKYPGDSERKLKEIFQKAEERAPSIIFIDHIDSIAPKIQGGMKNKSSFMEHRVVAQLLGLMDGLRPIRNVIVIATTHKLDLIEPALLRPGRFDKIVHFSLPGLKSRTKIYEIHTRNLHLNDDVSVEDLAELSDNFTGADIKGVCQLATINAAKIHILDISPETNEISDNEIDEIKLNKQDFLSAIKEIAERVRTSPKNEE